MEPEITPSEIANRYESLVGEASNSGDWHEAYRWCKGWIGSGGGGHTLDPWLGYVGSTLLQGQPRGAVHAVDVALQHWISGLEARGVLHYVRGEVVRSHLRDPKVALGDLEVAVDDAPDWLVAVVIEAERECRAAAVQSRKRK